MGGFLFWVWVFCGFLIGCVVRFFGWFVVVVIVVVLGCCFAGGVCVLLVLVEFL